MTLKIHAQQLNKLAVTLSELKNENLPNNWLFNFVHDQSEKQYFIYLNDQATIEEQERFNLFFLDEGTDLTFDYEGDYHYFVYQMPDGGSFDTDEGQLVEQGIAIVKRDQEIIPEFEPITISPKSIEVGVRSNAG